MFERADKSIALSKPTHHIMIRRKASHRPSNFDTFSRMPLTFEDVQSRCLVRIVDDDPALRRALGFFLKVEGWKSTAYEGPGEFVRTDDRNVPGCLILDLQMPGMTGTDLQKLMKTEHNQLPIVFISAHGDIDTAVLAVLDGAVDFLQKPVDEDRLLRAVEKGCRLHMALLNHGVGEETARQRCSQLTEREQSVARLVADGLTTRTIAERLGVSPRTVEVYRAGVYRKLGVRTASEIARMLELAR